MKLKNIENSWMKYYAPPGIPLAQEVRYWMVSMVVSTLWAMYFIIYYFENRGMLFKTIAGEKYIREGAMMPTFEDLMTGRLELFALVVLYCLLIAVYHYFYHYQGSKMMYLMKRLPNKKEVHIRCLSLPICASIITLIYMFLLRTLFYAIYILCTPSDCLVL